MDESERWEVIEGEMTPLCTEGNTRQFLRGLFVFLLVLVGCAKSDESFLPVLMEHLKRHPDMRVEDVYKLVHHGAMGNDHLFHDTAGIRLYLLEEMDEVPADSSEPLTERLTPDGSLVRLNLRPYKAFGGDVDRLIESMIRTSTLVRPRPDKFEKWWNEIMDEAEYGTIPIDRTTLRTYFEAKKEQGFPAVHHSEEYEASYAPAYRVLLNELVPAVRR